ncbi:thioredoxin domain-containing protein 17 [Caerostris extrusa]|uniref:Thioredoxin domain-containing protein 17 n=1 Tax=Caerostris extrusa TaxID=172846 RepID=A0AAV4N830_CAEEX|nr:thioredoxin domain-containing protein 17 [Caerostris extrusa]
MVKRISVEGYEAVKKAIDENSKANSLFVLFCGSKDDKGQSWCPDCVSAEPVIEEGLKIAPEDSVFIYCSVGDRTYCLAGKIFKPLLQIALNIITHNILENPNNEFRKDEKLRLTGVPTLIKWNTVRRLDDEQCRSAALVTMLFEE